MPRCGGGAAGRLKKPAETKGGQISDRSQQQHYRAVSVPHIVTKMPCRSRDRQGIASFYRRSPRKGRTLQAHVKTAYLVVCSQRPPVMLAHLVGRAGVSSCQQRIWSVIRPATRGSEKQARSRSGLAPRKRGYRSSTSSEDMSRVSYLMVPFDAQKSPP
jgi:hypothetical protein